LDFYFIVGKGNATLLLELVSTATQKRLVASFWVLLFMFVGKEIASARIKLMPKNLLSALSPTS
jgi:hypothetical protein